MSDFNLNALLKESLKHAHQARVERAKATSLDVGETSHSAYADEANWISGRILEVIHKDEDGVETNLGVFQEFFYTKTPGSCRKLVRSEKDPHAREVVRGAGWLDHHSEPNPETAEDVAEIRRYLSRRTADEVKEVLKRLSAEDALDEFLK